MNHQKSNIFLYEFILVIQDLLTAILGITHKGQVFSIKNCDMCTCFQFNVHQPLHIAQILKP